MLQAILQKWKIEDFCDGNIFKQHAKFSNDPYALQILAYFDEIEVCNSLGSHVKNTKEHCYIHNWKCTF